MKRVIYIVLSLVMSLSLFGCGARTYPVEQVHEHVTGFSVDEVRKAILMSTADLGWTAAEQDSQSIKAVQERSKYGATVVIKYRGDGYDIVYGSSYGLKYDGSQIHGTYNRWLQNLNKQIKANLQKIKL